MVQIFCNDDQAGDASLNILDSLPRAVRGHILIAGQHDDALQVFTAGQPIIHGIIQIHRDDIHMHPPYNHKTSPMAMSSTIDVDQPLIIHNPKMAVAPFEEPDFLRLPRPMIPYKPYPGLPLPNFNYRPCMLTPELIEEPGVILGDD
jgi:hypothetical protein